MDSFVGCYALFGVAIFLAPLIMAVVNFYRVRNLEATLRSVSARLAALESGKPAETPPALVAARPLPVVPPAPLIARQPVIDWEAFMGVKLSAWIGGFALFLGIVFLVKYSFENNLITPALRVLFGVIAGLTLVAAGWVTARKRYRIPGQSLCATGVLVLYAAIFGAHTFYGLVSLGAAFAFMSIITLGAILLAVRMDAAVIVVLGLVGGFATPPLLTTSEHPLPIFAYLALLNCGIVAVALRKRWDYLVLLAALGTATIESLWLPLHSSAQLQIGFPVFLAFQGQFLLVALLRQRLEPSEKWSVLAAALMGFAALGFGLLLLEFSALATRTAFFFGGILLADVGLLALTIWRPSPARFGVPAAWIALGTLIVTWGVQLSWHHLFLAKTPAPIVLAWYAVFALLFITFPYFFAGETTLPWAIGALSGLLYFTLVLDLVSSVYPQWRNGLVPAAFVLPYAIGILYLVTKRRLPLGSGDARLAWQGLAALLFVMLIVPIQFHGPWITLGWAVLAFALLLVGMKGGLRHLRYTGLALLFVTLLKLFFNDLANLAPLYRIAAFIGVAFVLIVASFVYQRFLAPGEKH